MILVLLFATHSRCLSFLVNLSIHPTVLSQFQRLSPRHHSGVLKTRSRTKSRETPRSFAFLSSGQTLCTIHGKHTFQARACTSHSHTSKPSKNGRKTPTVLWLKDVYSLLAFVPERWLNGSITLKEEAFTRPLPKWAHIPTNIHQSILICDHLCAFLESVGGRIGSRPFGVPSETARVKRRPGRNPATWHEGVGLWMFVVWVW